MKQLHVLANLFFVPLFVVTGVLVSNVRAQSAPAQAESGYREVGASITGASQVAPAANSTASKLELDSSDSRLVDVFQWAKRQALAYAFDDDPVGPWYEAVEPGREGFCIRDTCHQALGAHSLGLARHNLNMLRRFAENISDARDWCSAWEINRGNHPAPVDYQNDAEFWYNLPANFDLVDCCFRMYVWSGDETYVKDAALLNLYDRTVNDYVDRWGLGLDQIMQRPRLMNVRGVYDPKKKFQSARGIPGYDEGDKTYVLGFDVIATQYAAYLAYANLQAVRGKEELSRKFLKKAADLKAFAETTWWNEKDHTFYTRLNKDHQLEGGGRRRMGLDWGTVRYDDPDQATEQLVNLKGARLEYPEVSFTRIGTIVSGTMGINLVFTSPLLASVQGYWVETAVKTQSGLGTKIAWAELRNLAIRSNEVSVRHEGMRKTTFTNHCGPALIWLATFDGAHDTLLVNGKSVKAHLDGAEKEIRSATDDSSSREGRASNRPSSWVRVTVGGGGSVTVEVPQ